MKHIELLEEAQNCRRKALAYLGQPEAAFLLRVATEFEELDADRRDLLLIDDDNYSAQYEKTDIWPSSQN